MKRVIVFGSLNMDLTIEAERIPAAGETMTGRGFFTNPGGKGANQAVAAARMGAETYMVGAAGADPFGDQLISSLVEADVDCANVERLDQYPTGVAMIMRVSGDNRIILDPGANHALRTPDVAAALARVATMGDILLTQLECDFTTTLEVLELGRKLGLMTAINPAPAVELPEEIWKSVDVVCVNETECEILTGVYPSDGKTTRQAIETFMERGVKIVAITLGSRGSVVGEAEGIHEVPARNVSAIDTTCAGDTYIGALVAGLAAEMPLSEILSWASCASALATTRLGAQQSIPSLEEVECELAK
ncbi:ribokinase [Collinsella sp. AGMB00827]|uniref:Ribokinase n=1 Tax=Collinsella ureilytica TaxID=2869515 RepID=A0ABS7MJ65_9ACTN|nr:ribokinase [Collinsella urealyticum]MBY4797415.1 ribokinase [Collinsella urealyticum]